MLSKSFFISVFLCIDLDCVSSVSDSHFCCSISELDSSTTSVSPSTLEVLAAGARIVGWGNGYIDHVDPSFSLSFGYRVASGGRREVN